MTTIKDIFDIISAEPGTNKKMELLKGFKNGPKSDLLKRVLYLANSKRMKYYIKQIPDYVGIGPSLSLEDALDKLKPLSDRTITGHAAIQHLAWILSSLYPHDAYIIERIIEKDCKLGMGTTNINKIYPKLIENTPYMGAKPFNKEIVQKIFDDPKNGGYAYSQVKMDGRYLNAIIREGDVELESRAGEPTLLNGAAFLEELKKFPNCVLNAELTMDGMNRYDSNGIINSLITIEEKRQAGEDVKAEIQKFEKKKNISYRNALNMIRMTVWDVITVEEYFAERSDVPYHDRLVNLSKILKNADCKMISFVKTRKVYSYDQAITHFQELLKEGQEGTILKASMGAWEDGKKPHQIKMKLEMDVDLKIVGFNYGTGKNSNVISSLNAESSDGKVFTRPTGINEDMMNFITTNQDKLLGTIVEVKCCGLSHDSNGNYSLLHPVFKTLRNDKKTCDSLESIKGIEAAVKGLAL